MSDPDNVDELDLLDLEDVRVVAPRDIVTRPADDRGRVTLGTQYAGSTVTVAVLAVESEPPSENEDDGGGGE